MTLSNINFIDKTFNNTNENEPTNMIVGSCPSDNFGQYFQSLTKNQLTKATRAMSYNECSTQLSSKNGNTNITTATTNNNRLKHLCTRLKRHFSLSKDGRARSEDMTRGLSMRFSNYKLFSTSADEACNDFDWPDFEKVYDSIPICLIKNLPGLDDISAEENDEDLSDTEGIIIGDEDESLLESFQVCKRGPNFRRNAICRKLDKTQYKGQWDTFIQQLMVEKLMRTWT